ncbi:hypothetical protein D2A30_01920 [Streptococcus suis]|uniref:hypothetical protein n=1 Tax=Streptococcus parasuis TaxID=1501662 RepID=UPI001EF82EFB|nr:hypothetical protein [Streptococcus suis]ULL20443.1 hypothetical protein D2A30_01920 [Streptococcus suis]
MKRKAIIGSALALILLTSCSTSTKTYPSLKIPYEVVNEEIVKIENISTKEEHKDNQTLRNIEVRDLTDEESKRFSERIKTTSKVALEENYSAVEFDFGKVERVFKNKSFIKFDEDNSYFILNDEKVLEKLYQILNYENKTNLIGKKEGTDEDIIYGETYEDLKIITIIRNDVVKKGLQFRTVINGDEVYFDIK